MNYCVNKPYPSVEQLDMNVAYGQMMLSNLGGLHSEMNAVSLYFYNHVITKQSWSKLAKVMQEISFVEMHHLEIFADMCTHLGVDPRLWDCQNDFLEYWSPGYNVYPRQMNIMLENAIKEEENTIRIYQSQIACIDEPIIQDVLNRIILDEQLHIHIFQELLDEHNQNRQERMKTDFY